MSVTTSTFAWLTSNSVASTNAVSGSTDADTNLYVKGSKDTNFSNTATFNIAENFIFQDVQATSTAGKFTDINGGEVPSSDNNTSGIMKFTVQFQGEAGRSVGIIGYTVKNTTKKDDGTGVLDSFVLKADMNDSNKTGSTVTVDILDALAIQVGSTNYTLTDPASSNDAHTYYKNLTGYIGTIAASDYDKFSPSANSPVKLVDIGDYTSLGEPGRGQSSAVSFYVFLNGLDKDCFDAIRNQKISIEFKFGYVPQGQTN